MTRCNAVLSVVLVVCSIPEAEVLADPVAVRFDVTSTVPCRDVTTDEFRAMNPDEKLVEAKFEVSSLVGHGHVKDWTEYLIRIVSPEHTLKVADYLPKTTLDTQVVGKVGVEQKQEKSSSLGLSLSGSLDHYVKGTGTGSKDSRNGSILRFERLPDLVPIAASGTIERGSGAYFKMRASTRTSLEGAKEFTLVLRVPSTWRGDYVRVLCEAYCYERASKASTCGGGQFQVALYLEGDVEAKTRATRFARAERGLRTAAKSRAREIKKRRYPSFAHEVGALLDVVDPKIPPTWLHQVLYDPAPSPAPRFRRRLPKDVQRAVAEYVESKHQLVELNG